MFTPVCKIYVIIIEILREITKFIIRKGEIDMKRFICLLLSALMLTACSSASTDDNSDESSKTTQSKSKDPTVVTQVVEQEADPSASYITGNYATVSGEVIEQYPRLTNLPTLYINLDDGLQLADVQHDIYSSATYTFVDEHIETSYYELPLQIKGRGNYSWTFAQKPYTIKLDAPADLMGMGSDSKWVLITLSSDKSMMHNYLTQKLAADMGLRGTVENEYIDVIVNGQYSGTYVLTESVEIDDSRIDVPKEQGILLEVEKAYRHTCELCIEMYVDEGYDGTGDNHSVHIMIKEYKGIEFDDMDDSSRSSAHRALNRFFSDVEDAMKGGDFDELDAIIDIDSFVNWYLLNEFTNNYDSSFTSSVYCYINEEGKLYMGPCWDYDTAYGIQFTDRVYDSFVRDTPWYRWLFENSPEFVERLQARWAELREEDGLIDQFVASIDPTVEYIAMSEKMQHHLYPNSEQMNIPFEDAVRYMKDWLDTRIEWMDWEYLPAD